MLTAAAIEAALREALPADRHGAISTLAQLLAEASTGELSPEAAQDRLVANRELTDALRALKGHRVEAGGSVISFAGAQTGDVTISGEVAGRDVFKINLAHINTGGGDYAEGSIDKRRGPSSGIAQSTAMSLARSTSTTTRRLPRCAQRKSSATGERC